MNCTKEVDIGTLKHKVMKLEYQMKSVSMILDTLATALKDQRVIR